MKDESTPAPSDKKPKSPAGEKKQSTPSRFGTMPYLVAAFLVCGAMAWYLFLFVPSQIEYFIGLRFRTLAIASGQVRSKIESLQQALNSAILAVRPKGESEGLGLSAAEMKQFRKYCEVLLPDIHLEAGGRSTVGLSLRNPATTATVAWESIVSQARAVSLADFDDLLLATNDGKVVWQREKTTGRVGNLSEILNGDAGPEGWLPSFSWRVRTTVPRVVDKTSIPETAEQKSVNMNGRPSFILVQGISLSPQIAKPMYLAGVVSQKDLQQQAMRIPTAWIVLISVPLVLLFLALPFVKLATLTSKERYRYSDVVFLTVATVVAAQIGTTLPFVPLLGSEAEDHQLTTFAKTIEDNLASETKRVLDLANFIQDKKDALKLAPCEVELINTGLKKNRCDLWEAIDKQNKGDPKTGSVELDVAIWINSNGAQVEKWTTKRQVTAPASHEPYPHFRDLKSGHLWHLAQGGAEHFTIDPVRSPTTSELAFTFAVPDKAPAFGFVLNVRPQSVVDPIIPPGYGFAILGDDGRVLFHSEDALSLEENFYDEVSNSSVIRAEARSNRDFTWTGEYHGRPHRLHMQPMKQIVDSSWRIVTFRSMEPLLAAQFQQQADIVRLIAMELIGLGFIVLLFVSVCRTKGRELSDQIIRSCDAKQSDLFSKFGGRIVLLSLLAFLAILGFVLSWWLPIPADIDYLYVGCGILPLLAACVALAPAPRTRATAFRELLLLVFLLGIAPAASFSIIVYRLSTIEQTAVLLRQAEQQWSSRDSRIQGRIKNLYNDKTLSIISGNNGFANNEVQPERSYLNVVGVTDKPRAVQQTQRTSSLAQSSAPSTIRLLRWSPFDRSKDEIADPGAYIASDENLEYAPPGSTKTVTANSARRLTDDLSSGGILLGLIVLGAVAVALYLVSRKLAPGPPIPFTGLENHLEKIQKSTINEGVLLIGPPRGNKDRVILEKTKPVLRIPLLGEDLSDAFIKSKVEEANKAVKSSDKPEPRWIHLSNLEAQLMTNKARKQVVQLLDRLLDHAEGEPRKAVIVSSTIDPVAHFKEVFEKERADIYADAIPEVELGRPSLLLSRFHRCYLSPKTEKADVTELWNSWLYYDAANWKRTAELELGASDALNNTLTELEMAWGSQRPIPLDDLARTIQNKAQAYYELLWTSCTRSEKLVLIQLAQEGFINPKSCDVMTQLVAKGLVVEAGSPAIFNYTFRRFLRDIERHSVVNEWEAMDGSGLWVIVGRLAASTLIVGAGFYLVTQDLSVQSLLPLISGSGFFGIPVFRELVARLSTKPNPTGAA